MVREKEEEKKLEKQEVERKEKLLDLRKIIREELHDIIKETK